MIQPDSWAMVKFAGMSEFRTGLKQCLKTLFWCPLHIISVYIDFWDYCRELSCLLLHSCWLTCVLWVAISMVFTVKHVRIYVAGRHTLGPVTNSHVSIDLCKEHQGMVIQSEIILLNWPHPHHEIGSDDWSCLHGHKIVSVRDVHNFERFHSLLLPAF